MREQTQHERARPATRFHPGEPARHPAHQALEYSRVALATRAGQDNQLWY
ncbi:hypothetical protein [Kitasatospora sp. NPDC001175]